MSSIESGVYSDVNSLIDEINGLECMKSHLKITKTRGGYVTISQICGSDCSAESHEVSFSKKLKRILGFETLLSNPSCSIKNGYPVTGKRPANLTNALPNTLMVYRDILKPLITGDVQARLLRAISLDIHD